MSTIAATEFLPLVAHRRCRGGFRRRVSARRRSLHSANRKHDHFRIERARRARLFGSCGAGLSPRGAVRQHHEFVTHKHDHFRIERARRARLFSSCGARLSP